MPLIRARSSMHRWRRTSFLFLMVLKLCGCEECEYSVYIWTHLCSKPLCFIIWLWGKTRKDKRGKRVSWNRLGKDFSDVSVPLVEGGTTLLMIPSGDKLRIFDAWVDEYEKQTIVCPWLGSCRNSIIQSNLTVRTSMNKTVELMTQRSTELSFRES